MNTLEISKHHAGFSLIELLVSISILTILASFFSYKVPELVHSLQLSSSKRKISSLIQKSSNLSIAKNKDMKVEFIENKIITEDLNLELPRNIKLSLSRFATLSNTNHTLSTWRRGTCSPGRVELINNRKTCLLKISLYCNQNWSCLKNEL